MVFLGCIVLLTCVTVMLLIAVNLKPGVKK